MQQMGKKDGIRVLVKTRRCSNKAFIAWINLPAMKNLALEKPFSNPRGLL